MDNEQLEKRIKWLDDERRKDNCHLSTIAFYDTDPSFEAMSHSSEDGNVAAVCSVKPVKSNKPTHC